MHVPIQHTSTWTSYLMLIMLMQDQVELWNRMFCVVKGYQVNVSEMLFAFGL